MKPGRVERYILSKMEAGEKLHLTLIDPINVSIEQAAHIASFVEKTGSDAIMVGGSTVHTQEQLDKYIMTVKSSTKLPILIFPNNVQAISKFADAIWFMSLLNSVDWYYIVGAHLQGALTIKLFNLEAIPMGYVVFGHESTVAAMGRVLPLSPNNAEVAACYGLAAQYLGMRFLYLEAGSGAAKHLPQSTIQTVRKAVEIPIIVGGGIRSAEDAEKVAASGADIIVTGTAAEKNLENLVDVVQRVKSMGRK